MSFGGLTNFAKNAILTAQKHIDSALQIEEDDEEEVEDGEETEHEQDNIADGRTDLGTTKIQDQQPMPVFTNSSKERIKAAEENLDFLDIDLNGPSPPSSQWGGNIKYKNENIVDTEPNPIRDAHEPTANVLHYSPSSHSPDDDESSQNEQNYITERSNSDLDISLLTLGKLKEIELDKQPQQGIIRRTSERTLDRFEEIQTIASSDIEVIRQIDDYSIASSQKQIGCENLSTNLNDAMLQSQMLENTNLPGPSFSQHEQNEQMAIILAKLKHRDQRIEELGRLNENLKASNMNLVAKNKQRNASETKLQILLTAKEKHLEDLLAEGKRLSEYSGRQAKEIRKLKQQLTQLELITAARDSAMEELREAHLQIQEQETIISQLQSGTEKADKRFEQHRIELEKAQENLENMENQLCHHLMQLEKANAEVKRMEMEIKDANREKGELIKKNRQLSAQLINKTAQERVDDEREQGLLEDLQIERAKTATAAAKIRELEQRLECMQDAQRDIAVEISNANSPLLKTIVDYEEKILDLERQNDNLSRLLKQSTQQQAAQKSKYELEMELAKKTVEEERQINTHRAKELTIAFADRADSQSRLKELQNELVASNKMHSEKINRLEHQLHESEMELKTKRAELSELRCKNSDLQKREALATKEQMRLANEIPYYQSTTADSHIQQPINNNQLAIKTINSGNISSEFQKQRELLRTVPKQHQSILASSQNSSTVTSREVYIDLNLPRASSDYALEFSSADHLRMELDSAHAQLYQLRERFDHLLELYGGCLESIEEMKEDNEDLRKLCKEQATRLVEFQGYKQQQQQFHNCPEVDDIHNGLNV